MVAGSGTFLYYGLDASFLTEIANQKNENQEGFMARSTPVVRDSVLFFQQAEQMRTLSVETPEWYAWLAKERLFAFECDTGSFTARKERASNGRGSWYWRAYRKQAGKVRRAYLGKSEELTQQHLQAIATKLAASVISKQEAIASIDTDIESDKSIVYNNLPFQLTSFIGRTDEVEHICQLIQYNNVRLLTITGPGGVGKTRLGLRVAETLAPHFQQGVCFVPLATVSDRDLVLPAVAQTLSINEHNEQSLLEILKTRMQKWHLLLVLDNFEQVTQAAIEIEALLLNCPRLYILVTSRSKLHIQGEHEYIVSPLAFPDKQPSSQTPLANYASIALFCERARAARFDFQLTSENQNYVIELCRCLDGLPLAIELAAAHSKLLSPQSLLARVKSHQPFLTNSAWNVAVRQQTLRNTIQWSYDLLSPDEQTLFRRLAIFCSGCTIEAVERLYELLGSQNISLLEPLATLMDKSLLFQREQVGGEPRLLMLQTLREFALDKLATSDEALLVQKAHACYYLELVQEADVYLLGFEQTRWLSILEYEHENIRTALRFLLEQHDSAQALILGAKMVRFWTIRGHVSEGRQWLHSILSISEPAPLALRADALVGAAWLCSLANDLSQSERLCQESLQIFQLLHNKRGEGLALHRLGLLRSMQGDGIQASHLLEESVCCYRKANDQNGLAYSLMVLGDIQLRNANLSLAVDLLEKSLSLFQAVQNIEGEGWSLTTLAQTFLIQKEYEQAYRFSSKAQALFEQISLQEGVGRNLNLQAQIDLLKGNMSGAIDLLERSADLFTTLTIERYLAQTYGFLAFAYVFCGNETSAQQYWHFCLNMLQPVKNLRSLFLLLDELIQLALAQDRLLWIVRIESMRERLCKQQGFPVPVEANEHLKRLSSHCGKQLFLQAWSEGQKLALDEVFNLHSWIEPASTPPVLTPLQNKLSEREREILHLLVQGLSNKQIAEQFIISTRTVDAHVRAIYRKLDLHSRTAVVHYAIEHHLD